jgi:hypothetical protein
LRGAEGASLIAEIADPEMRVDRRAEQAQMSEVVQ